MLKAARHLQPEDNRGMPLQPASSLSSLAEAGHAAEVTALSHRAGSQPQPTPTATNTGLQCTAQGNLSRYCTKLPLHGKCSTTGKAERSQFLLQPDALQRDMVSVKLHSQAI